MTTPRPIQTGDQVLASRCRSARLLITTSQKGVVEATDCADVCFRTEAGLIYIADRYDCAVLAPAPEAQQADPDPTGPQPVADAYRCGDLTDDEWEAEDITGKWRAPSWFSPKAIRPARRKPPALIPVTVELTAEQMKMAGWAWEDATTGLRASTLTALARACQAKAQELDLL